MSALGGKLGSAWLFGPSGDAFRWWLAVEAGAPLVARARGTVNTNPDFSDRFCPISKKHSNHHCEMSVHADPPPSLVREPRRFEYETGEQLGKGGFAICHRAALLDNGKATGRMVALKIVRSKMEPPKLAQKVSGLWRTCARCADVQHSLSRSCKYTPSSTIQTLSISTVLSPSKAAHTLFLKSATTVP